MAPKALLGMVAQNEEGEYPVIEIAGLILSGVSVAKDLLAKYNDFNEWPLMDRPVDRDWLPLALEKNLLKGTRRDYSFARPERIPTLELKGSHEVVIVFNEDKKEAYRITEPGDRPSILIKKTT